MVVDVAPYQEWYQLVTVYTHSAPTKTTGTMAWKFHNRIVLILCQTVSVLFYRLDSEKYQLYVIGLTRLGFELLTFRTGSLSYSSSATMHGMVTEPTLCMYL